MRYLIAAFVCVQLTLPAVAADADPPERVARISYLKGDVGLQSQDEDWTEAKINRPLTTGGRLRVEPNARAELQTGAVNVQLDGRADLTFLELTDSVAQMRLTDGAVYVSVRRLRGGEVVEIDTPQAAVALVKPGEYAIAVVEGGTRTRVRTFEGECEVTDHRQTVKLGAREQATFADGNAKAVIESVAPRNAFEFWAHERNLRGARSASSRYVAPDVIGYDDLDEYGDWVSEVDYGYVWYPRRVVVGWAPFRHGHWAWVSPWGWTWVDDAPWGFAPFHYGRWAHVRGRWCWVPGPIHVRPVYAPALVAWVGGAPVRSSVSFTVSFGGGIGWFPLGPREIYVPSYRCSRRYLYGVNHSNTVVVNNIYINRAYSNPRTHFDYTHRHVREAVTVVREDAFRGSRSVREHIVDVDHRELRNWNTHNTLPEVRPAVREHRDDGRWRGAQRDAIDRAVVMRNTPAPVRADNITREHASTEPRRSDGVRESAQRSVVGEPVNNALGDNGRDREQLNSRGGSREWRANTRVESAPGESPREIPSVERAERVQREMPTVREQAPQEVERNRVRESVRFEERSERFNHREIREIPRQSLPRAPVESRQEYRAPEVHAPVERAPIEHAPREHVDRGADRRDDSRSNNGGGGRRAEFER